MLETIDLSAWGEVPKTRLACQDGVGGALSLPQKVCAHPRNETGLSVSK